MRTSTQHIYSDHNMEEMLIIFELSNGQVFAIWENVHRSPDTTLPILLWT